MRAGLQRCAPFAALDSASLDGILGISHIEKFPRRRPLYQEGSTAEQLFVVSSGRVRVVRGRGEHRMLTVAYRGVGDLVGETGLAEGHIYRATASATEPVEALAVPLRAVRALLQENPRFSEQMLLLMVERRIQAERRVESLLSRTVESRVAEFLIDAAERHGIPESRGVLIGVKYTHQEIADYVGSTRETVTLTLGDLRRRELLQFDHRRIVLTDPTTIRALV
ncbi:MAG: Crp/Fnr family transcriptional regulator [Myxococcales bacterium]|jgi:CRP-like cAMP-binding protein